MEAPSHVNTESTLQQKVESYKNLSVLLKWLARCILLLAILYAILPFLDKGAHYKSLDNKMVIGYAIAANSSGTLIAFSTYDQKDSVSSILVSSDSGKHFEQIGGPWKNYSINKISVAPDDQSIVAYGDGRDIYIKPAGKGVDSFVSIHIAAGLPYPVIYGYSFVPQTDSVYFYCINGNLVGLDYKKCDSFIVGHLHNIGTISSMSINTQKQIALSGITTDVSDYEQKLIVDNYFDRVDRHASADFKGRTPIKDSIKYFDATAAILEDTMVKVKVDSPVVNKDSMEGYYKK
ncbi:hypothetical protein [Pinibacter soli]|uniref:Uncharacterized protein n=1 Tax=Pinibacter soli TaxID=3044211 RepID=A0ABT6RC90_9BACT|nr:hypothetical protein [Pinibacter soli]MDI3320184.1 hypothetical protein [Pinibacter soli]